MTDAVTISSDQLLVDVDAPFRVFAGPGAGKTHWLVEHVQNVTARSSRLHGAARIAVISFTNVAADEVVRRLGPGSAHVEVSTIHGFLYRNVVKPYLHFVTDSATGEPLFDFAAVDGHDDHVPSYKRVTEWLDTLKLNRKQMFFFTHGEGRAKVDISLRKLRWERESDTSDWALGSGSWEFRQLSGPIKDGLLDYKKQYWKDGHLDHDDVLRFAHLLLTDHPPLLDHLSARFPYVFVDEFQDTSPLQAELVRWMAERGATVGVIGDAEQSIYGFNGAAPEQFMDFELPGVVDYVIEGNRRSTDRIVEVLNRVRADGVEQRGTRETLGEEVAIVVGNLSALAEHMATITPPPTFLAWRNDTVREFKRALGDSGENLWADFYQADGVRAHFFEGAAAALAYDAGGRPDEAVRALLKAIRPRGGDLRKPLKASEPKDPLQRRALAVDILVALRSVVETFSLRSLMDVYDWLGGVLDSRAGDVQLTRVNKGKFRTFAEAAPFGELLNSVDISEPVGDIRTIHKAKGAEFDSVLLRLEKPESQSCLSSHAEIKPETRRTVYVGLSRARDKLVVSVDKIEDRLEQELSGAGMSVLRIQEAETGVPTLRQGSLGF